MEINKIYHAVAQLHSTLIEVTGFDDPITQISIKPEIFDELLREYYKNPRPYYGPDGDKIYKSTFRPSDAHFFKICGILIKPRYNQ